MALSKGVLPVDHRYCSVVPALDKFPCSSVIPTVNLCCRSSFAMHPAWITKPLAPQRCQWISHCFSSPGPAWKRLSMLERPAGLYRNVPVLVRGECDGFYYRGTVKEEMENERGVFLVEFAKLFQSHGRHPVCVQKTVKDDILEYANGMKHSLLPGDKVLAPWEPDMVRYGPGTVLTGIETRDPLRASEDEEIMVQFWNNKKVKLPLGVALWIPPSLCGRIVEMINMPFTSRSLVFQRETGEAQPSSKYSPHLLELEGPNQEESAAVAASSPSSDSECDLESLPTKSTVVDCAVNTDSSWLEKPRLEESAGPKWKYWKTTQCKSHPSNSGIGCHSSTCAKGKLESKAICVTDTSCVAPADRRAVFETTEQSPRGQVTVKEVLRYQDFKPSSGEEGFAASGKQRYKRARKNTEPDDKCKANCTGEDKLDDTDHIRRGQREKNSKELTYNKAERDMINQNSINVQLMKFKS